MGFSRQEYWSGLPCPPPGDLPEPRDRTHIFYVSCIFFFTTSATWEGPRPWSRPLWRMGGMLGVSRVQMCIQTSVGLTHSAARMFCSKRHPGVGGLLFKLDSSRTLGPFPRGKSPGWPWHVSPSSVSQGVSLTVGSLSEASLRLSETPHPAPTPRCLSLCPRPVHRAMRVGLGDKLLVWGTGFLEAPLVDPLEVRLAHSGIFLHPGRADVALL